MKISTKSTPTGFTPDPTVQPSAQEKPLTLEALTTVLAPRGLSDAEIPLWKVLEAKNGKDTPEKKEEVIIQDLNHLSRG